MDYRLRPPFRICALILSVVPLTACAAEVRVSAAAAFTDALAEIAARYERESGTRIVLNFAGTPTLERQIAAGAPVDILLAADEPTVDRLEEGGLVAARTAVLSNALVVVVPADGVSSIRSVSQLPAARAVAIADPSSVPAGIYARDYLMRAGVWGRVAQNVIPTENVRAALAAVAAGNADAAIVYRTDARASSRVRVIHEVAAADAPRIVHPFALLTDASADARRFFAWLQSSSARATFAKHGFIVL